MKDLEPTGRLYAWAKALMESHNNVAFQANAEPVGTKEAPPQIGALNVVASGGYHHFTIQDNSPVQRGLEYFIEWDTSPNFTNPQQESLGPDRTWRPQLGVKGPIYARAYSAYKSSPPSEPVYAGGSKSAPQGFDAGGITLTVAGVTAGVATVTATGVVTGPTPPQNPGSGTEPSLLPQASAGFGFNPTRESGTPTPKLEEFGTPL